MAFVIYCLDKDGHGDVRAGNRAAHLEFLEKHRDKLVAAGPLLSDDGAAMVGSLLIVDLADRAAVDAFCAEDPYARAGLFRSVTVHPWRQVYPKS